MSQQFNLFDEDFLLDEGVNVEYKASQKELPSNLWETYSAFANTQGGKIYLGVKELADGRLEICGVDNPHKLRKNIWDLLNNPKKVSQNILQDSNVYVTTTTDKTTLQEKSIITIEVPKADISQRPIFLNDNFYSGTFKRNHEGDYKCSRSEVDRFLSERYLNTKSADSDILPNFSLEDLDSNSLKQFRMRMSNRQPDHPYLVMDDKKLLEMLGGWRIDRGTRQEGLTSAGLLMFGKTYSIQALEAYPNFHLDYREKTSEDPNERWSDRITIDGMWEANLFQFYQRVMQKIMQDDFLKIPFSIDENGLRKGRSPVHDALEEALVNALIHADHRGVGGIVIERYRDRFEFSNPGDLLISREQIQKGGVSECRNKSLQQMFFFGGAGDKAGSGLEKIRKGWEGQCWQPPSLNETQKPERVYLVLPLVSLLPEDIVVELRKIFGEKINYLSPDEIHTMVLVARHGQIKNEDLQSKLVTHRVDIGKMLKGLVEKGLLTSHGYGRSTYYNLFKESENNNFKNTSSSLSLVDNATSLVDNATSLVDNATSLVDNATSLVDNLESNHINNNNILMDFSTILNSEVSKYKHKKRQNPNETKSLIMKLCSEKELKLVEIADILNKKSGYIRVFVSELVANEQLKLKYPDKPTHSQQAYYVENSSI